MIIKNGLAKIRFKTANTMDNNLRKFQHLASAWVFGQRPKAKYFSVFGLWLRPNEKMQHRSLTALFVDPSESLLHKAGSYLHNVHSRPQWIYTIGPSSKRVETRRNALEWVEIDHNPLQTHQTFNEIASQWVRNTRFLLLNVTQLAKERSEIFFVG